MRKTVFTMFGLLIPAASTIYAGGCTEDGCPLATEECTHVQPKLTDRGGGHSTFSLGFLNKKKLVEDSGLVCSLSCLKI